jgi:hypothetical protein
LDRVVSAIRSAANPSATQNSLMLSRRRLPNSIAGSGVLARKREQEETEAARRQEERASVSGLEVELRTLRATDPDMSLLDAVKYITPDRARRLALYGRCILRTGASGPWAWVMTLRVF